jgi:hypothetical protein
MKANKKTDMLYIPLENLHSFTLLNIMHDLSAGAGQEV